MGWAGQTATSQDPSCCAVSLLRGWPEKTSLLDGVDLTWPSPAREGRWTRLRYQPSIIFVAAHVIRVIPSSTGPDKHVLFLSQGDNEYPCKVIELACASYFKRWIASC
ncbi:hypothetical protein RRG08_060996 [Elysia crispata]|uniref:Uncharacterized protein n=1 Tax=Elysia crispata TaxID=231223 RepID=A0AAE1E4V6_9GAST|nr:hypothetical protein RRG08_060996 [Elysia crispata]